MLPPPQQPQQQKPPPSQQVVVAAAAVVAPRARVSYYQQATALLEAQQQQLTRRGGGSVSERAGDRRLVVPGDEAVPATRTAAAPVTRTTTARAAASASSLLLLPSLVTPATNYFPMKLHDMLDEAERRGHAHIVSWCPNGQAFQFHYDPPPPRPTTQTATYTPATTNTGNTNYKYEHKVLPVLQQYFKQTRFKSYLRQLMAYQFVRVTKQGPHKGTCSHPAFQRGRRSLCTTMVQRKRHPKATAAVTAAAGPAVAAAAQAIPAMALPKSSRVPAVPPRITSLAAATSEGGGLTTSASTITAAAAAQKAQYPKHLRWTSNIKAQISKRPSLVAAVMPRVVVPSSSRCTSSSLVSTMVQQKNSSNHTNTTATEPPSVFIHPSLASTPPRTQKVSLSASSAAKKRPPTTMMLKTHHQDPIKTMSASAASLATTQLLSSSRSDAHKSETEKRDVYLPPGNSNKTTSAKQNETDSQRQSPPTSVEAEAADIPTNPSIVKGNKVVTDGTCNENTEERMSISKTARAGERASHSSSVSPTTKKIKIENKIVPQVASNGITKKKNTGPTTTKRKRSSSLASSSSSSITSLSSFSPKPSQSSGRWTHGEHQAFLVGLNECGREWKTVASRIPTRTSAQIRSHAQKYFAKLQRRHAHRHVHHHFSCDVNVHHHPSVPALLESQHQHPQQNCSGNSHTPKADFPKTYFVAAPTPLKRRRSVSSFPLPKCIPSLARTTEEAAPDKAEQHTARRNLHDETDAYERRRRCLTVGSRSHHAATTQDDHATTNSLWSRMTRQRSHGDGMGSGGGGGGAACSLRRSVSSSLGGATASSAAAATILPAQNSSSKDRTTTPTAAPPRPNFVPGNEYMFSIFDYHQDIDEEISNLNFD